MTPTERTEAVQRRLSRFRSLADRILRGSITEYEIAEFKLTALFLDLAEKLGELPADTFEPGYLDRVALAMRAQTRAVEVATERACVAKGERQWN